MGSRAKNVMAAAAMAFLCMVATPAFAQGPGGAATVGGCTGNCTSRSLTLKPGPLRVGGGGISTDGGIALVGSTSTGHILQVGDATTNVGGTVKIYANPANVNAIEVRVPGSSTLLAYLYGDPADAYGAMGPSKFAGPYRSIGVAHASHPACTSSLYGAAQFCTTHGALEVCGDLSGASGLGWRRLDDRPPMLMGSTVSDGLAWSGTNVRAVITMPRDWTATHISSVFAAGTGTGTAAFTCFSLAEYGGDGGTCSFGGLKCSGTGGCPDGGDVCGVPASGQCNFAANANVFCTGSGAAGCVTTQPSSLGVGIYGSLGSINN